MADPAQNADADVIVLGKGGQALRVDEADVAGIMAQDGHLARVGSERFSIRQLVELVRPGHDLVDHGLRFRRDSVDNVIDADGLRDVVNEKEQPTDAGQRQHHGAQDGGDGREGAGQRARRGKRRHAVEERAEEDTERPLRDAVPGEADDDARGELHRCQGERHQQDGEHDRHHRHDGGGDARQNDLGDLRVGVRGEEDSRHPGAGDGKLLFQPRQECAHATERQRDGERANQKAATQVIHSVAKHQR